MLSAERPSQRRRPFGVEVSLTVLRRPCNRRPFFELVLLLPVCRMGLNRRPNNENVRLRDRSGRSCGWVLQNKYSSRDLAAVGFYKGEGRAVHRIESEPEPAVESGVRIVAGIRHDLAASV